MKILTLNLKGEYFDAIKRGEKTHEYRLATPYWRKRLEEGAHYDEILILRGYPKRRDQSRRLRFKWLGTPDIQPLIHAHFGPRSVKVYCIPLTHPIQ